MAKMSQIPLDSVSDKTEKALLLAFWMLMQSKSYEDITVQDIVQVAEISRSTFYRHYAGKVDLLLAFHRVMFEFIGIIPENREAWLSDAPSEKFIMVMNFVQANYHYRPFIFKLGNEVDYFTREQKQILSAMFQESLESAFCDDDTTMPYDLMAQAMSGIFLDVFLRWFEVPQRKTATEMATHLHQLLRSLLLQDIKKSTDSGENVSEAI